MSIPTDSKPNGDEPTELNSGINTIIGGETLAQRNDREFKTRELIRSNNKAGNLNLFAFLITLFTGIKGDEGLNSDEAISDMAGALSIDKSLFETTLNDYKSDSISAYEAARITKYNIDNSPIYGITGSDTADATVARAEAVVIRYAQNGNPLLELIAAKESNGDYNRVYGKGVQRENLTEMSINEVLEWQRNYVNNGSPSSAAGKYQIIKKTLAGLKDEMGLTGNEKYDEEMQDRMAMHLLNRRGYDRYLAGDPKMDEKTFMENVAKEWASMPKDESGLSYYAGDGLNKAHATPTTLLLAMRSAKDMHNQPNDLKNTFAQGGVETKDPKQPEPLVTAFDGEGRNQIPAGDGTAHTHDGTNNTPSITVAPT